MAWALVLALAVALPVLPSSAEAEALALRPEELASGESKEMRSGWSKTFGLATGFLGVEAALVFVKTMSFNSTAPTISLVLRVTGSSSVESTLPLEPL